jgi:hypothetical protein
VPVVQERAGSTCHGEKQSAQEDGRSDCSKLAVHEACCLLYTSQTNLLYLGFRLFWLQFIHNVLGIFLGNGHIFGMTAPCHDLIVLVDELNGCESKRLADWSP